MNPVFLRRAAAIAILLGICVLFVLSVLRPLIATFIDQQTAISSLRQRLEELTAQRIDPASLAAGLAALESNPDSTTGLLKVDNETEAGGRLDAYLRTLLQVQDPDWQLVRSVSVATNEEGVRVVRANITLQLPQDSALQILATLETGSPALFFEASRLRRSDTRRNSRRSGTLDLAGTVRVYLDLPKQGDR